ncbi:hypothetical protein N657DRAFT_7722 [Parathielavia appendiculata]|uniref:Uncharacterized protein n=1 Tax=Parathielavia appendiculata TaxID=2587402 RepID=A0AAN6U966_9PEZI|nr:hypothetical protein N657DRAFT_7722 [Parathielavia appendiculata]
MRRLTMRLLKPDWGGLVACGVVGLLSWGKKQRNPWPECWLGYIIPLGLGFERGVICNRSCCMEIGGTLILLMDGSSAATTSDSPREGLHY